MTSDGICMTEIKSGTDQAKDTFQKMKSLLSNKSLSLNVRNWIFKCDIKSGWLKGCKSCNFTSHLTGCIAENLEMWHIWLTMWLSTLECEWGNYDELGCSGAVVSEMNMNILGSQSSK